MLRTESRGRALTPSGRWHVSTQSKEAKSLAAKSSTRQTSTLHLPGSTSFLRRSLGFKTRPRGLGHRWPMRTTVATWAPTFPLRPRTEYLLIGDKDFI